MPLVPAICTQCGSYLEVDTLKDAAICPYCHTPFVTEKAINNYNTTNVTRIENLQTDTVVLNDTTSIENRVHAGETFIKLGDFQAALETFQKLVQECPYDYRSWWGLIRVKTEEFTSYMNHNSDFNNLGDLYDNVKKTADPDSLVKAEALFDEYKRRWNKYYDELTKEKTSELTQCEKEYKQTLRELEANKENLYMGKKDTDDSYNKTSKIILTIGGVLFLGLVIIGLIESSKVGNFLLGMVIYGGILVFILNLIMSGLENSHRSELAETSAKQSELDSQIHQLEIDFNKKKTEIETKYKWLSTLP